MNRVHICEKCRKEFNTLEECGNHAQEENHYTFRLKGTNLTLGIL